MSCLFEIHVFQLQPRQRITAIDSQRHRYFADLPRQLCELHEGNQAPVCLQSRGIGLRHCGLHLNVLLCSSQGLAAVWLTDSQQFSTSYCGQTTYSICICGIDYSDKAWKPLNKLIIAIFSDKMFIIRLHVIFGSDRSGVITKCLSTSSKNDRIDRTCRIKLMCRPTRASANRPGECNDTSFTIIFHPVLYPYFFGTYIYLVEKNLSFVVSLSLLVSLTSKKSVSPHRLLSMAYFYSLYSKRLINI